MWWQVEILAEGDHVNELMVIVSGLVEVRRPSEWMGKVKALEEESVRLDTDNASIRMGSRRERPRSLRPAVLLPMLLRMISSLNSWIQLARRLLQEDHR